MFMANFSTLFLYLTNKFISWFLRGEKIHALSQFKEVKRLREDQKENVVNK
jgi:hypothetical protein